MSFAIFATGVLLFECDLSSRMSSSLHGTRFAFARLAITIPFYRDILPLYDCSTPGQASPHQVELNGTLSPTNDYQETFKSTAI
jgi:hypothetical protein